MMEIEITDCVVLGGGPAGTTFASIAKEHAPHAKVVVLEQARTARGPVDDALLDQSRRRGADVREGTRAIAVRRVGRLAAPVVSWEDDTGRKGRILADFVLDAAALAGAMRRDDEDVERVDDLTVLGYLRHAPAAEPAGGREAAAVRVAAFEHGWVWCFRLGPELTAVGVVTRAARVDALVGDAEREACFWDALRACPELANVVSGATLRDDVLPAGMRVAACPGWSTWLAQAPALRSQVSTSRTRSACAAPAAR